MVSSLVLAACGDDDEDTTTGGGGGQPASDTATIAFVGPLTGENANLGINIRDAMKVAIEEENAKGGTKISMKEFDTQGDPAQASTLKDRFISDQSIIGIVGPTFSGETKALIPDLVNAGLVMISPSATNKDLPTVTANNNSFHRIIGDDALQAAGIAEFLSKERPRSVAYVHDNTEYGKPLAEDVERLATAKGIAKATSAVVDPKAQDFSSTVNALEQANPSHIFYGGYYAEAGRFRKQLTDAGVTAVLVSGDGSLDPGFVTAAGAAAAEGSKLSSPSNLALETSTGALKTFYDSFKRVISKDPGLYSPEGYDAAKMFIQGIKAGNKDRPSLLKFVEDIGKYEGISKAIEFEANGNLKAKVFFVFEVKGGKITPLQSFEVA